MTLKAAIEAALFLLEADDEGDIESLYPDLIHLHRDIVDTLTILLKRIKQQEKDK